MRKTLLATFLGLAAFVAAACGNSGATGSPDLETVPTVESPSDMLESPSDMLESPSDMLESESPS